MLSPNAVLTIVLWMYTVGMKSDSFSSVNIDCTLDCVPISESWHKYKVEMCVLNLWVFWDLSWHVCYLIKNCLASGYYWDRTTVTGSLNIITTTTITMWLWMWVEYVQTSLAVRSSPPSALRLWDPLHPVHWGCEIPDPLHLVHWGCEILSTRCMRLWDPLHPAHWGMRSELCTR